MVEDTTLAEGKVCIHSDVRQGQHILVAGTDISLGETVLEAGQMLSPAKIGILAALGINNTICLLYTSPSPRDRQKSRMPSSA